MRNSRGSVSRQGGEGGRSRLRDVLWLMRLAIGRNDGGPEVRFGAHVRNHDLERTPPLVRLKAVCGPGDQGEPVNP